jgi:hypothetical protein
MELVDCVLNRIGMSKECALPLGRAELILIVYMQVSDSICSLMSHNSEIAQEMPHVDRVFTMMDSDGDGVVTQEDFFRYCITTNTVRQSLEFLP